MVSSKGKESVWDYPRPPRIERTDRRVRVQHQGRWIADSRNALRVLETSHPPAYYLPPTDVEMDLLIPVEGYSTYCEWKGRAFYYDLVVEDRVSKRAAWYYPEPVSGYEALKDHVSFYPSRVEACFLDEERVKAQEGNFYGGWITSDIEGPFKGGAGTLGW
jgi:uncharacterized protein (DUF427 family)